MDSETFIYINTITSFMFLLFGIIFIFKILYSLIDRFFVSKFYDGYYKVFGFQVKKKNFEIFRIFYNIARSLLLLWMTIIQVLVEVSVPPESSNFLTAVFLFIWFIWIRGIYQNSCKAHGSHIKHFSADFKFIHSRYEFIISEFVLFWLCPNVYFFINLNIILHSFLYLCLNIKKQYEIYLQHKKEEDPFNVCFRI
jgi:hypothetical protein